jgi:two-component system, sensor histidine kinase YesM
VKRISELVRNLSVSWKFIFAYYCVMIIPMAFFGVYFYMQTSNSAISQARLVMEQNLLQTRASILQKAELIEKLTQIITTNDNVRAVFYYDYKNENYRLRDFQFDITPLLSNINWQNDSIYATRIYTPGAVFNLMPGSYYSIRKKDSPDWYEKTLLSMPIEEGWTVSHKSIGNELRDKDDPPQVFSYSNFILSPVSKESTGLVEIEVKENQLLDMLRDTVISKWGEVFVADSAGVIVSNNIPDLYQKSVDTLGFTEYTGGEKINDLIKLKNKQSIVIAIPIEDIGCSIVGIFPAENFLGDARGTIVRLLVVLAILSVLLGTIIYVITNMLLRRIKRLVKAMKQVKDNNLDVSVPISSMDEFGELAENFNHMTSRIHDLVETVYKIQLLEREAELKALEAQINPHFLYNTLATISWVARKGSPAEVVRISNSLARFYRLVLSKGGTMITVRDEIDMVRSYLQIQKIRFEEQFDVIYELDESALDCMILKNLLQPLVENALLHGIEPKRAHGLLILRVKRNEECLTLEVTDDGIGMDSRTLADVMAGRVERSGGGGYAVKNVIGRLAACYAERHTLDIFSRPGIGTQVIINIKMDEKEEMDLLMIPSGSGSSSGGKMHA